MWRPWSRPFEVLGRLRFPVFFFRRKMSVGHPGAVDALGGWGWREYRASERLHEVWGPVPGGPWTPFHCVPLFAALDRIPDRNIGPTPPDDAGADVPPYARPGAAPPAWLSADTWTIVDLPGPTAVQAGAWLVTSAGCQPVCTFDNWPHPKGVLRPERTLAELLRWATTLAAARASLEPSAPPVWICDSERLGSRRGRPGEFDNRYYLDDSILPGAGLLKRSGITRVIYVTSPAGDFPVVDLESYFAELLAAGIPVLLEELGPAPLEPRPFAAPRRLRPPPRSGFRRSAAGGFGTEVPEPSSGGSG